MTASTSDRRHGSKRPATAASNANSARNASGRSVSTPRGRLVDGPPRVPQAVPPERASSPGGRPPSSRGDSGNARPNTASTASQLPTPRGRAIPLTPRGGQTQQSSGGPGPEAAQRPKTHSNGAHPPRGPQVPPLRLNQGDAGNGRASVGTPRGRDNTATRNAFTERSSWCATNNGSEGDDAKKSQAGRDLLSHSNRSNSSDAGRKESGTKRSAHADADFPALTELSDQAMRKRGVGWKNKHKNDSDDETLLRRHQQENSNLHSKVSDARAATAGPLSAQLLSVVADNERLCHQLHGLHMSASALRQAIAEAQALQMRLQQEAADARLLAVGLQAQLNDARASSTGAADDSAAARAEGARLVHDCVAMFGLSIDDIWDSSQASRLAHVALGSSLDARSLSLMQNTQALLGPCVSATSTAAPRPATAAAQHLSFGSFSPVARSRSRALQPVLEQHQGGQLDGSVGEVQPLRLAIPRLANEEPKVQSFGNPANAPASRMAASANIPQTKATATPNNPAVVADSCTVDAMSTTSTPGSAVSASSHIASRIANLQMRFAAAEQLLQGDIATTA